ncbi:EF-hand domain-containing protein [Luteimonas suaedae]|uniref:EF-hand domain-containing protein n=1 Tax=Luteimonas suaedae TaxID=2605430 RepID=UPI001659B8EE|nr:EF-hand domain-containing protein [Luteimonas suaedae]
MKSNRLFAATLLALGAFATAAAVAQPAAGEARPARMQLDSNGDGAIDRSEAAAHPRLAERFDRLDKNGDGRIDADERPRHGGKRMQGGGGHDRMGFDRIARLDADGDGRISRAELEQAAGARKEGRGARFDLGQHFDAIDTDRDGQIARGELRAWHARQLPQRRAEMAERADQRFAAADLNGDGKLSRVEVEEKMPRLARNFAWMDESRDGFLSREELRPQRAH